MNLPTFAERLRWLRSNLHMTMQSFGERCGCKRSYLSRLESGKQANPSQEFLHRIAEAFAVDFSWLSTGEGDPGIPSDLPTTGRHDRKTTDHLAKTLRYFRATRTQAEFARFLGIPGQQTYQRYEYGLVMPSGLVCLQIAERLGITVEQLLRPGAPMLQGDDIATLRVKWLASQSAIRNPQP